MGPPFFHIIWPYVFFGFMGPPFSAHNCAIFFASWPPLFLRRPKRKLHGAPFFPHNLAFFFASWGPLFLYINGPFFLAPWGPLSLHIIVLCFFASWPPVFLRRPKRKLHGPPFFPHNLAFFLLHGATFFPHNVALFFLAPLNPWTLEPLHPWTREPLNP